MTPRPARSLVCDPALPAAGRRAGDADAVHLDALDRVKAANRNLLLRPASDPLPLRAVGQSSDRLRQGRSVALSAERADRHDLDLRPSGAGCPAGRLCPCQVALPRPRRAVRAGRVLHPDPAAGDRDPGVPAAAQARRARQLRGAGAAVHDLGVRHLPDAPVLQDRARRPHRCGADGRDFRVRHRLARDAADRDPGGDGVRHLLGGGALERLFLAADRAEQRASADAAAGGRASSATTRPAPTTGR